VRSRLLVAASSVAVLLAGGAFAAVAMPASGPVRPLALGDFDFGRPEVVASGLEVPWGMAFLPDGSALVAQRIRGQIVRVRPGAAPVPVATVPGVAANGEGGLLGIAISPSFSQDNLVYAYFTTSTDNRIVRFRLDSPANPQPILIGLAQASIHDGGRIAFGPDGMLYAGVGDASQSANAQNQASLNGKILRMRPDGTVPPDNPFPGSLVYSLGHRNVQGLAWDAQSRLYATEFGQNTWDEVNLIVAGGNYGWPTVEGQANDARFRNPIVVWATAEASPSGAAIVGGRLFAAALRGTRLWTVPLTGAGTAGTPTAVLQGTLGRLRTVALGPDGWLWVTTSNRDGRGTPAATDDRVIRFPPVGTGTTTPPVTTPPVSTPPGAAACTVGWQVNQWDTGFTANLTVTNRGPALSGWSLMWTFSGNQQLTNFWNATLTRNGAGVTAANLDWNANLPTNGTAMFGFQASYSGTNARPTDFRLNGTPCPST
jgi:glucose/arabinose dehydrogenase